MSEWKLCPFCKRDKAKVKTKRKAYRASLGIDRVVASVRCTVCKGRGPTIGGFVREGMKRRMESSPVELTTEFDLKQKAVEAWNRRSET